MKTVKHGLLYDTSTASKIGTWDNGLFPNDFGYVKETLHKKKTGEYFLHGEGGANSKYGVWHGNSGGWGEVIRPYTPEEAREWAEEHLDADVYIDEFGDPGEGPEGKVSLNLSVLASTKAKLERMRQDSKRVTGAQKSISQLIDDLIGKLQ